jgi:hypothetical protein
MLILMEYNRWANERIYRRAVHLGPAELNAAYGQTRRTISGCLLHLADAQWYWRVLCETGQSPGQELKPEDFASVHDLRAFSREEAERLIRFAETLTDARLNRPHTYSLPRRNHDPEWKPWSMWSITDAALAEIGLRLGDSVVVSLTRCILPGRYRPPRSSRRSGSTARRSGT